MSRRICSAQRLINEFNLVVECEREEGHKKKHQATWRDGEGSKWVDVVVKWKGSK